MENPLYLVMVLKSHGKPIVFSDGSRGNLELEHTPGTLNTQYVMHVKVT